MGPEKIILINGAPRSGTSFLGQIIDSSKEVRYKYQPFFSESFRQKIGEYSSADEILEVIHQIYHFEDDFLDRKFQKEQGIYPVFKKENPKSLAIKHVRYHFLLPLILKDFSEIKLVAIIRNPLSQLFSWRNAPKEFLAGWDFIEEWEFAPKYNRFRPHEYYGYNRWKEITALFHYLKGLYPDRVKILQYESLVNNIDYEVREVFEFLDLKLEKQTLNFIEASQSKFDADPYSVFKGGKQLDQWKSGMEDEIVNKIVQDLKNTSFEKYLI